MERFIAVLSACPYVCIRFDASLCDKPFVLSLYHCFPAFYILPSSAHEGIWFADLLALASSFGTQQWLSMVCSGACAYYQCPPMFIVLIVRDFRKYQGRGYERTDFWAPNRALMQVSLSSMINNYQDRPLAFNLRD